MKDLIHFAHGNGFPSPSYDSFLKNLKSKYDYGYIDCIGHNPQYPVTDNWPLLVEEIINSIKQQADKPVIAVGHSLGGVLSFLASIQQPELFKAVVMLDSPLLSRFKTYAVHLAKVFNFIDKITPAAQTKDRRNHWKTWQELINYLKSRPLFKTFNEQCLLDYATYGFKKKADGYYLRFKPEIEYKIFKTIPHIFPEANGKLIVPTALIYGDDSRVVSAVDRAFMEKHFDISCHIIKGTHLFPFEYPQQSAERVIDVLDHLIKEKVC